MTAVTMKKMNDRYLRYSQLLPIDKLQNSQCMIIGVGAIGRQVSIQLASMGVNHIELVDFDNVEEVNLGTQGYLSEDIGLSKVEATKKLLQKINPSLNIKLFPRRFNNSIKVTPIIFCCVDSIEIRGNIWNKVKNDVEAFFDGRMAAEVIRIISVANEEDKDKYKDTLFRSQEAYNGGCTQQSTIYCANMAAALMIHQFTRHLRGFPVDFDLKYNLLSSEITI